MKITNKDLLLWDDRFNSPLVSNSITKSILKKEKRKKLNKYLFNIGIYISLFILFIFIHELSHIIVGLYSGNRFLGFTFEFTDNTFFSFGIGVKFDNINYNTLGFQAIAGSLGSSMASLIFLFFAIRKKNLPILTFCFIIFLYESLYWSFGSLLEIGDPSNLFWYFEYQLEIYYSSFYYFLLFLVITILIFYLFISTLIKVGLDEIEKY